MAEIPNSWISKSKLPKVKTKKAPKDKPKHTPTLCRSTMNRITVRG